MHRGPYDLQSTATTTTGCPLGRQAGLLPLGAEEALVLVVLEDA